MECQFCERELKNQGALKVHENSCKSNPNKVTRKRSPNAGVKKGNIPWNKGLKSSEETKDKLSKSLLGKTHSQETKDLLSKIAKDNKLGGYVPGSGLGKKGWFKGYWCDSSWELAWVIYHIDHNVVFERNTTMRQYEWNGETKIYIPDFIVDGKLIEIKGYKSEQWLSKLESNKDVEVLYQQEMKPFLDYAIGKYGKDFTRLYGEHPAG